MNFRVGKYVTLGSIINNRIHTDILRIFFYQNILDLIKENGKHIFFNYVWHKSCNTTHLRNF